MKYEFAEDLQKIAEEISQMLFPHIKLIIYSIFIPGMCNYI